MAQTYPSSLKALCALRKGEAIVFPTDTVFGLGVSVRDAQGPQTLYQIKQRDKQKPIAWLVADPEDLLRYGKAVSTEALQLARAFWPGPLTLVVKASNVVSPAFSSSEGTIGLRMPANETALSLIRDLGCPIATTSANISGNESVLAFADLDPAVLSQVPIALDDHEVKSGIASTVVDCSGKGEPVVVREGALSAQTIKATW